MWRLEEMEEDQLGQHQESIKIRWDQFQKDQGAYHKQSEEASKRLEEDGSSKVNELGMKGLSRRAGMDQVSCSLSLSLSLY